jgi:hypothetical protein
MDATPDFNPFAWMQTAGTSSFAAPFDQGGALAGVGKAWMQEMTALMASRLRADADAVLAMGACTTLTDLALLQQRWLAEAGQTYSAASQRFAQLAIDAARGATDAAMPGAAKPEASTAQG